jgi:hypothetical protein
MQKTLTIPAALAAGLTLNVAQAQTFAHYNCNDGTQFAAAFYEGSVALQLDGKALLLPQRLALPGNVRYAKSGVTISIKRRGQSMTLQRAGVRSECTSATLLPFMGKTGAEDDDEK